jgi:hypothetical protein
MPPTEPATPTKVPLSERLKALMVEYGSLAVWVYFGIFAIVLVGFVLAISFGFHAKGHAGTAGTWGAAYLATKLTQPLRIAATLVLTPFVMKVLRLKKRTPATESSESSSLSKP